VSSWFESEEREKKEMGLNEAKMSNYCKPVCLFVGSNYYFPAIHNPDSDMRERETESVRVCVSASV